MHNSHQKEQACVLITYFDTVRQGSPDSSISSTHDPYALRREALFS